MVAVLSPDALPQIRMTVDEYMTADLPEGYRYELVEGVVQMSPTPGFNHDAVIEKLNRLFVLYSVQHPELLAHVSQRAGVVIAARETVREPDMALYGPREIEGVREHSWKAVAPLLVVEAVSPGQGRRDYEDKRRDYWDAGVGEYWIADGERGGLTVLTRGADDWQEAFFAPGQSYEPARFPGLVVDVAGLFETQ